MERITIKLQKGEYTNVDEYLQNHDVIMLSGARGSGKSFPSAKYISSRLVEDKSAKFVYMRIRNNELSTFYSWCSDLDLEAIAEAPKTALFRGKPTRGDIMLCGYDEEGKLITERVIGKCVSLESSHEIKSGKYAEFICIIFEEYAHLNMNPENEKRYVFNFLENVETIFRGRPKKIILICNSLQNIPLLDRTIDELTGEIFDNPIKIKIFRKSTIKNNSFIAYLNGETYSEHDSKINLLEFNVLYANKKFVIYKHKVINNKFYVSDNKGNKKCIYGQMEYLDLASFCNNNSTSQFFYKSVFIETAFINEYEKILKEITVLCATSGASFIAPYETLFY